MAILDKVLGAGEALRDKLKETFGDPRDDDDARAGSGPDELAFSGPPLDLAGAYAALGLAGDATLADVREAYRARARALHPLAVRDGVESSAQRELDRSLEALELLEEHLVPLSGAPPAASTPTPAPTRKRATPRR